MEGGVAHLSERTGDFLRTLLWVKKVTSQKKPGKQPPPNPCLWKPAASSGAKLDPSSPPLPASAASTSCLCYYNWVGGGRPAFHSHGSPRRWAQTGFPPGQSPSLDSGWKKWKCLTFKSSLPFNKPVPFSLDHQFFMYILGHMNSRETSKQAAPQPLKINIDTNTRQNKLHELRWFLPIALTYLVNLELILYRRKYS